MEHVLGNKWEKSGELENVRVLIVTHGFSPENVSLNYHGEIKKPLGIILDLLKEETN